MVEVDGAGILPACSTRLTDNMVVRTNTKKIRELRKMIVELMLASHDTNCTTCPKSGECKLQSIARQLGVDKIRFKDVSEKRVVDASSMALLRDQGKCVLCGDCVRVCKEVQGVGALDFAYRGANTVIASGLHQPMSESDCVNCGQCVKICPVGALAVKPQIDLVWDAIDAKNNVKEGEKEKIVVVQMAPAVRVAVAESFGGQPGENATFKIISALRMMGFDKVFDICFGADFTVVEEGKEFLERYKKGEKLPLFTSCCPAWVKFAEQTYPELLPNLSTARSPQAMFGALCKDKLSKDMNIPRENITVVSIMPCTAKKYEAAREELSVNGNPDVDYVITTTELTLMIKESGIDFNKLELGSFDMPFGYFTGGAVIFGASGGVSEAVLRFAADTLKRGSASTGFKQLRHNHSLRTAEIDVAGTKLRLAVVSGLQNAKELVEKVKSGEAEYDLIEVMACCGGCVNGGGQPVIETPGTDKVDARAQGLYDNDKALQFHISSENPELQKIYTRNLDEHSIHALLHTHYGDRKRTVENLESSE
jgi:NADH-quinone oxidoreductase subunit G